MVAQNLLRHTLYFSKNQQQISSKFPLVNFECLAFYYSAAEQYVFWSMCRSCHAEVRFKQLAVIKFLVAEKE